MNSFVTRERLRALGVAYGLGIAGAVLALVLSLVAVQLLLLTHPSASIEVVLGVLFVSGQYLPFLGVPLLYLRLRGHDWHGVREYLRIRQPTVRDLGVVAAGFLLVLVLVYGALLVVQILGLEPGSNQAGELAQRLPRVIPLFIVASFVVIGPCEEVLFRGVVQNRLREAFSAPVAVVLATALFAAVHITAISGSASARLTTIVILFVPGIVFGAAYEYTENLVVSVLIHSIWNAFVFTMIYVQLVYAPGSTAALL